MTSRAGSGEREWDAEAYRRVAAPQLAWGKGVLERVEVRGDEVVADIGCGDGRLTSELAALIPRGRLVACDRSANMTSLARQALAAVPNASVVRAEATALPFVEAFDTIFSGATFHWVLDHETLFRSLYLALKPGGVLIAQYGGEGNLTRVLGHAESVGREEVFAPFFEGWERPMNYASERDTADWLTRAGFGEVETSLEPKPTTFPTEEACVTFLETVVLRLHVQRLPDLAHVIAFLERVGRKCGADAPPYTLDYRRLNIRARRLR